MNKKRFISITLFALTAACCGALFGCADGGYSGDHDPPDFNRNDALPIERNRLGFARGMDIDTVDVIVRCGCYVTLGSGEQIKVTEQMLDDGTVGYERFDVDTVGSDKRIKISYGDAYNYIVYDVNEYTVNFYTDDGQTELWQSVAASAALTDTLGLSVWTDISAYNYSTDETAVATDDRAARFDGWYDTSGYPVTGLYPLPAPRAGNSVALDLHARFLTVEQAATLDITYDAGGRRVFSGYKGGATERVVVPEGVTYVDLDKVFDGDINFTSLHIPSTATLDLPFTTGTDTFGLSEITVDRGNREYASYNGALYSRDHKILYLMPAANTDTQFHASLVEFGSYSCAYWRATELTIPVGVKTLRHYCFAYSSLTTVRGLQNVKSIMAGVFFKSDLTSYDDGVALYARTDDEKFMLSMMLDRSVAEYKILDGTTWISGDAFNGCAALKKVTLCDGLTGIGESAFSGCTALTEIVLPSSLRYASASVFFNCVSLKSVKGLPDLTFVDNGVEYPHTLPSKFFYNCASLTDVELPDGMTTVGESAFYDCASLTNIALPDSVRYIAGSAFRGCGMTEIELPVRLKGLGVGAFAYSALTKIDLSRCVELTALSEGCFQYSKLKEVVIPERFTVIPYMCFYNIATLEKIDFGEAVEVGELAVSYCKALKTVVWGNSVQIVGERAFSNCTALTEAVLPDSVEYVARRAFQGCSGLKTVTLGKNVRAFGSYELGDDGLTFGDATPALWQCLNVQSISVSPENPYFTSIDGVLYGSTVDGRDFGKTGVLFSVPAAVGMTELDLPDGVKAVTPYAFQYQRSVSRVRLDEGLINIGKAAFYSSSSISEIYIPSTVSHIGSSILLSAKNIKTFTIAPDNQTYSSENEFIYKGDALVMQINAAGDIVVKDGVTEIGEAVFMNNAAVTSVVLPDSVTAVGNKAFNGCAGLKSIHIGANVRQLDDTALSALKSLERITVDPANAYFKAVDNVLYTADGRRLIVAAAKNGMTELDIESGVVEIVQWAFAYHATLETIILPDGIKTVGDYAFYECRKAEKLVACESLERIGNYAFSFVSPSSGTTEQKTQLCNALRTVTINGNLKSIGDFAFYGHYGIEYTYFMMNVLKVNKLIANSGGNILYLTRGCPLGSGYVNNDGRGITQCLYSATEPTIDYDGYVWFYVDATSGEPTLWQRTDERGRVYADKNN